jgi:uncharacterized protein (UPF0332 family)
VIAQYGLHFAKTRELSPHFHQLLNRAFSLRQLADYTTDPALDPSVIRELIQEGQTFLEAAQGYLDREDTKD